MKSYRYAAIDLLNDRPELIDRPQVVADHLGCSVSSAKRYIQGYEATSHLTWMYDAKTRTTACARCKFEDACEVLDALELPVLCERVADTDLELARVHGLDDLVRNGRERLDA